MAHKLNVLLRHRKNIEELINSGFIVSTKHAIMLWEISQQLTEEIDEIVKNNHTLLI